MVRIFLYAVLFFQTVFSENYNDRLRIYIDNSLKNFKVYESGDFSNNIDLNKLLLEYEAKQIYQWLPNARPTDRDGKTYLNRYFIVLFESQSEYLAVIDLYKVDKGITNKKKAKPAEKAAAASVKTKSAAAPEPDESAKMIRESEVAAMSIKEYEKRQEEILDAQRSGNFIYDVSRK